MATTQPSHEHDLKRSWPWIALMWWFLSLVAYQLVLARRPHVIDIAPGVLLVPSIVFAYLVAGRRRKK